VTVKVALVPDIVTVAIVVVVVVVDATSDIVIVAGV